MCKARTRLVIKELTKEEAQAKQIERLEKELKDVRTNLDYARDRMVEKVHDLNSEYDEDTLLLCLGYLALIH